MKQLTDEHTWTINTSQDTLFNMQNLLFTLGLHCATNNDDDGEHHGELVNTNDDDGGHHGELADTNDDYGKL